MFEFAIGVAVGAAFAPFWMMIWTKVKTAATKAVPPAP